MDSDDEHYDSFDTETSYEMDNSDCGTRDSSFESLSAQDIVNLMNQYIDDVKSVVEVNQFSIEFPWNSSIEGTCRFRNQIIS